jgi:hypothetical protein
MNERINELSRIAKDWASDTMMEYNSNDSVEPIDFIFFYTKEFAELIVRECARLADNSPQYIDGREILEHFGVE